MNVDTVSIMFQLHDVMPPQDWRAFEQEFNDALVNNKTDLAISVVEDTKKQFLYGY